MLTTCIGFLFFYQCQPASLPPMVDNFCQAYRRVIVGKGDGAISANIDVKRRLAGNELLYRCKCQGLKSSLCPPPAVSN